MFKRIVGAVAVMSVTFGTLGMGYPQENETRTEEIARVLDTTQAQIQDAAIPLVANVVESSKRKTTLTAEEVLLMQKVVSAESRGESQEAQYTVACVILNRMESPIFPDSLEEVVRQSGQFTCVGNGVINNVPITESVEQAVARALDNNTVDENVLWFRSAHYHSFHNQAFRIGELFFSAA